MGFRRSTKTLSSESKKISLSAFQSIIKESPIHGIEISLPLSDTESYNSDGTKKFTKQVLESGLLILKNDQGIISEVQLSAILFSNESTFILDVTEKVDWENSVVKLGIDTDTAGRKIELTFVYIK